MKKSTIKKCACFVATLLLACGNAFVGTNSVVSAEVSLEGRYYDEPFISTYAAGDSYIVTFASKDDTYVGTPNNVPYYYNTTFDNGCGALGGTIIVGYFDKYRENLIPNYTTYYAATGKYRPQDSTYIPALIQSLYTAMQTNVVAPGVSEAECLNGLESYVVGKGYSISYTAIKPYNGTFNHAAYKNAVNNGQPVILFCDSVELLSADTGDTQDEFITSQLSQSHIVVGFGYRQIKYYDANNNNFRTDLYLKVASGWNPNNMGYIKINDESWLDSGYAVNIY